MIVVDTNVIAYLLIEGEHTANAEAVFYKDADWVAPLLWRSEFRNILAHYLRRKYLQLEDAKQIMEQAEILMRGKEFNLNSRQVLDLIQNSSCSAYDCEYVALAQLLGVKLVTADKKLLAEFPATAVRMQDMNNVL